ncbi:MAG TPA: hypothetical protein DEO84_02215 [candidate division Zixibacteria bacterium]|jgi:hypothetical protein|nr:hypothetical protein [candidate division Zixibacteria bacterium]HBZ00112.1 hypothetical protein [candidate division Zixibacteria bacterium]
MNKKISLIFSVLITIGIVLIPIFFTLPGQSKLWGEIQNFGHTLLTGILALLLLWISRMRLNLAKPITYYYAAFSSANCLAGAIEIAQLFVPGDADWFDFFRDLLGAGAFLCFRAAFDHRLKSYYRGNSKRIIKLPLLVSGVLMIMAIIPGLLWGEAYIHKNSIVPVICDFNSAIELKFIEVKDAKLKMAGAPAQWNKMDGDLVGQLDLSPIGNPGFSIVEPGSDWSRYTNLNFQIFSTVDSSIELHLGIEDFNGKDIDEDRFNRAFTVKKGVNEIKIPISEIETGPVSRKLELDNIRDIYLFITKPKLSIRLYIDNIKLTL